MSGSVVPSGSRGSYFDLYPERKPKTGGSDAAALPSVSQSDGKGKEPATGTTRNIFQRSSRQGSITSFVGVSSGKEKERERGPPSRRPSATPSFFAKAFGSNVDAKRDAALGLRRGSADQQRWGGGGLRRPSEASLASSSSSGSRSAARSAGGQPSPNRHRASISSATGATFPSARSSPQAGSSPFASTSSLDLEAFNKIPDRSTRSRSSAPISNFGPDIFPTSRRPDSIVSSRSSSSHPFLPPLDRAHSSSTSSFSSPQPHPIDPLDFDSAMDALFDSQDRPERPRSNMSRPLPRSSLGGFRPISNVFPSRPPSSVRTGSIRSAGADSSLRHSASLASIPDILRDEDSIAEEPHAVPSLPRSLVNLPSALPPRAPSPPAPPPTAAASTHPPTSDFAEARSAAAIESRGLARAVEEAEGGVEALVASMGAMGDQRPSETGLSREASKHERNRRVSEASSIGKSSDSEAAMRRARNREATADSLTSEQSFASMTAGPTPEQLLDFRGPGGGSSAPRMDRDATLTPNTQLEPVAPSIDDIIRSYGRPSLTEETEAKSTKSWGMTAPADGDATPVVSAVPFPRSTPRNMSTSSASPPSAAPVFVAGVLPPLRYAPPAATRSTSPPPPRSASPPPPLPISRSPSDRPIPPAVEFRRPAVDPPASSQPSRIKTIEEIIREHSGQSPVKGDGPTPAQALAAAARSGNTSEEEPRSSVDSVAGEILANLELQSVLERQEEEEAAPERSRKVSKSSLGKTFSLRLPRSSSSPSGLDSDDKTDSRSVKSTKSTYSLVGTPRGASPAAAFSPEALAVERELATLLRSNRLTRIVTLRRPPNQGLNVSLADVGSPSGHPVIVFLGLGCVRYLVALFEEMSDALGLRLICLDRWGLGRTGEVADDRRGFDEWASVVEEVAEQLQLSRYSLLAHSAGSPYALATALQSPSRVHGSIHLLAPWVSTSADSLAGAYKMLKYIPSGVIKSAQAAEWKMQAWRLGKPPTISHAPVGYDQATGIMSGESDGGALKIRPSKSFLGGLFGAGAGSTSGDRSPRQSGGGDGGSLRSPSSLSRRNSYYAAGSLSSPSPATRTSPSTSSPATRVLSPSGLPMPNRRESMISSSSTTSTVDRHDSDVSLTSPTSASSNGPLSPSAVTLSGTDLANGLLRASYAESQRGGTSDLMVILERTSRPWGFKYSDIVHPVKVWHGDRDERISMSSVKGLEAEMRDCGVRVVEGADHSLMTNGSVMIQVLESIAEEWSTRV